MKFLALILATIVAISTAHADVDDNGARIQYASAASQTVFDYPFEITADADLHVYVDGALKTLSTHYTVAGEGDDTGGTVTFLTGQTVVEAGVNTEGGIVAFAGGNASFQVFPSEAPSNAMGSTVPFTWGAGDTLNVTGEYYVD